MKNRKQLLANFYLDLLALPYDSWRVNHTHLYVKVRDALTDELESDSETVERIFERMASEDR